MSAVLVGQASQVTAALQSWQDDVLALLAKHDAEADLVQDPWQHQGGTGGGKTCVMSGDVIERAGVNFSHIKAQQLPPAATLKRPALLGCPFSVMGVSIVIHPKNPYVPTCHANARYFEVIQSNGEPMWWFGGGYDLTPYYGFQEDCVLWHQGAKKACDRYESGAYARFKAQCDDYFYLPHRNEARGVGGLFFDDLTAHGFAHCFGFMQAMMQSFVASYGHILQRRLAMPWGQRERDFQLYRRGRYVEFNLLHDRGTLFGLQSGGRTESILVSMPPEVRWSYQYQVAPGSAEEALYKDYLPVRDWLMVLGQKQ